MSPHYAQILTEDQRLVILRNLKDVNGTANDSVLQTMLGVYGHKISRDLVKTHLHWLSEQGLITIETILTTDIATLTDRGVDVADGVTRVPGVGTPRPGS